MAKRNKPFPELTRERLRATDAIKRLDWLEDKLVREYAQLDLGEVPALKLLADIARWRIDKVLPSLKAVEHSGDIGVTHTIKVNLSAGD